MSFENTLGKGEIARDEQFLLFPVFSTHLENFLPFSSNLKFSYANSFSLEESRICRLGKGLTLKYGPVNGPKLVTSICGSNLGPNHWDWDVNWNYQTPADTGPNKKEFH